MPLPDYNAAGGTSPLVANILTILNQKRQNERQKQMDEIAQAEEKRRRLRFELEQQGLEEHLSDIQREKKIKDEAEKFAVTPGAGQPGVPPVAATPLPQPTIAASAPTLDDPSHVAVPPPHPELADAIAKGVPAPLPPEPTIDNPGVIPTSPLADNPGLVPPPHPELADAIAKGVPAPMPAPDMAPFKPPQVAGPAPEIGATTGFNVGEGPLSPALAFIARKKQAADVAELARQEHVKNLLAYGDSRLVTPELSKTLSPEIRAAYPVGSTIPKSVLLQESKPEGVTYTDAGDKQVPTDKSGRHFDDATGKWVLGSITKGAPPSKAGIVSNEVIDSITPGNPDTLPQEYRQQVIDTIAGNIPLPNPGNRPDSPGNMIIRMAAAYAPGTDYSIIKARWSARQELSHGGKQTRGQSITSLTQLADHINELQEKSDKLNTAPATFGKLGDSDYSFMNALKQGISSSKTRAPLEGYKFGAHTVENEFIAALTGGRPSVEEQKALDDLKNPTQAKEARNEIIDTVTHNAEKRANAQEAWYQGQFGKSSIADGHPLFKKNWTYSEENGWTMNRKGGSAAYPINPQGKSTGPVGKDWGTAAVIPAGIQPGDSFKGHKYLGGPFGSESSWEK